MPDKPFDPRCRRHPSEIPEYVDAAADAEMDVDTYVQRDEGTYNPENGHFLCTSCYIAVGQPSSPRGWQCP